MSNLALTIAYDGGEFSGYARQLGQYTVQGVLEDALAKLSEGGFRTAVAGRTDRGVHALCQVVSCAFVVEQRLDLAKLARSLERMTPQSISIVSIVAVPAEFHARFSASWRRYRYLLSTAAFELPHLRRLSWALGPELEISAMAGAAELLLGERDFATFCRKDPGGATLVRRVDEVAFVKLGRDLFGFEIEANAFCHQMVRAVVGYLVMVGLGERSRADFGVALGARSRRLGVNLAPPEGLFLVGIGYREPFEGVTVRHSDDFQIVWKSRCTEVG